MLLTITSTNAPATDLGYLLHKNPSRLQTFPLSFGQAHVFYPEATNERCTAALLLDVDPIALVRNRRGPTGEGGTLDQYVNDRPYVASSFLSVAIARVLGSALAGRSKGRPELTEVQMPLKAKISVLLCRGGEAFLRRLFEPLGYEVVAEGHELDEQFPEWGASSYYTVELQGHVRLQDLLTHIYVLIPVLDNEKHYWVGDDEIEKLLRHGSGWLAAHPEKEEITKRYLKHRRDLAREALARLVDEESPDPDLTERVHNTEEEVIERPLNLNEQRINAVIAALKSCGAKRVVDLGCGEGKLLQSLLADRSIDEIVGLDVSYRALQIAQDRLRLDRMPTRQRERLKLIQGSLMYRDKRLAGYDAATVIEVIEHLDQPRLSAFERVLFEFAKPAAVVLTTPNVEYNARFETLPAGKLRHKDHRFEWTREQFKDWSERIAKPHGYEVRLLPVGPEDPLVGAPTQMAVFNLIQS
ncbi:MAG TPA: 3' terminal RNA ribose 2'-O-methyltransferase Hen1 [Pyrinomonadaceae bacterium]|nr:3' terminal RNA ribose 2'-O-methyltransferase Hen1 [Pyrinomonadaceae bacterium]